MLIVPKTKSQLIEEREIVEDHCNAVLERIINLNSNVEHYYILGALRFDNKTGQGKLSLVPSLALPTIIKDTFCYEVTKGGFKQLIWVTKGEDINFPKIGLKTKWCRQPPMGVCRRQKRA